MWEKVIKEPLFHFALLGALLFFAYAYFNPATEGAATDELIVTEYKINQLETIFQKRWDRPPSEDELEKLIHDYIIEEIYYREAIAMQMDKGDTIIRRRLRQKMEFLLADASAVETPTTAQLQAYLDERADEFAMPARYGFRQIYLNAVGRDKAQRIADIQQRLARGLPVTGDATTLPKQIATMAADRIDHIFGEGFAAQFDPMQLKQWQGPLESGFGLHWVYLEQYEPSRKPTLDEIRDELSRDYAYDARLKLQQRVADRLMEKYTITIERPKPQAAADSGKTR